MTARRNDMLHCWKDKTDFAVKTFGIDSPEYIDAIITPEPVCLNMGTMALAILRRTAR